MYVNKVPVAEADLMATNGVVHAVNAIIKPLRESRLVHEFLCVFVVSFVTMLLCLHSS